MYILEQIGENITNCSSKMSSSSPFNTRINTNRPYELQHNYVAIDGLRQTKSGNISLLIGWVYFALTSP